MRSVLALLLISIVFCSFSGCGQNQVPAKQPDIDMAEYNRMQAKKEGIRIRKFVESQGWETTETGTGIHIMIYQQGIGDSAQVGNVATVNMDITLLNGDTCYSWRRYGSESFVIEQDRIESGLHEAIQQMRVGDKAKIVLPSFRAFGVAGDRNRIPPRSSVVYDLELLELKK